MIQDLKSTPRLFDNRKVVLWRESPQYQHYFHSISRLSSSFPDTARQNESWTGVKRCHYWIVSDLLLSQPFPKVNRNIFIKPNLLLLAPQSGAHRRGAYGDFQWKFSIPSHTPTYSCWALKSVYTEAFKLLYMKAFKPLYTKAFKPVYTKAFKTSYTKACKPVYMKVFKPYIWKYLSLYIQKNLSHIYVCTYESI